MSQNIIYDLLSKEDPNLNPNTNKPDSKLITPLINMSQEDQEDTESSDLSAIHFSQPNPNTNNSEQPNSYHTQSHFQSVSDLQYNTDSNDILSPDSDRFSI